VLVGTLGVAELQRVGGQSEGLNFDECDVLRVAI
jgi:hypothetical protein